MGQEPPALNGCQGPFGGKGTGWGQRKCRAIQQSKKEKNSKLFSQFGLAPGPAANVAAELFSQRTEPGRAALDRQGCVQAPLLGRPSRNLRNAALFEPLSQVQNQPLEQTQNHLGGMTFSRYSFQVP